MQNYFQNIITQAAQWPQQFLCTTYFYPVADNEVKLQEVICLTNEALGSIPEALISNKRLRYQTVFWTSAIFEEYENIKQK